MQDRYAYILRARSKKCIPKLGTATTETPTTIPSPAWGVTKAAAATDVGPMASLVASVYSTGAGSIVSARSSTTSCSSCLFSASPEDECRSVSCTSESFTPAAARRAKSDRSGVTGKPSIETTSSPTGGYSVVLILARATIGLRAAAEQPDRTQGNLPTTATLCREA